MALSATKPRIYAGNDHMPIDAVPAQASVTVYGGGAQSKDANGECGPLAAGETFAGFAVKDVDNSSGSAGATNIPVYPEGLIDLVITGLDDNDDLGDTVYATDDDTFTLTSSGGVSIGKVVQIRDLTANKARVFFQAATRRSI